MQRCPCVETEDTSYVKGLHIEIFIYVCIFIPFHPHFARAPSKMTSGIFSVPETSLLPFVFQNQLCPKKTQKCCPITPVPLHYSFYCSKGQGGQPHIPDKVDYSDLMTQGEQTGSFSSLLCSLPEAHQAACSGRLQDARC